jgi:general secretion pathway protein D
MKSVVKQLDIRRAQVLIESLIVEVSGDIGEDMGVTWLATDVNSNNSGGAIGVSTPGNVSRLTPGSIETGLGPGITFGYFEGGDIRAAFRALSSNQKSNVLSTPTIVALDNEEAALLVGQNVPFITGSYTTDSDSSDNPFTTIERQDIGISLEVTPRINQGDSITLEIKQKTEDIVRSITTTSLTLEGASDIITNKREIITTALVKDDQILVLGGLISDDEDWVTFP